MTYGGVDQGRRRFLTATTTVVGAVGAAYVAVPFVTSWQPSARAKAIGAPITVDYSKIEPGQMVVFEWRGKPVYVLRRTEDQVGGLTGLNDELKDPASETSEQPAYISGDARSIRPEIAVLVGLCTHLGCAPKFRPEVGAADLGGDKWLGGFFCPCHNAIFARSGEVAQGPPPRPLDRYEAMVEDGQLYFKEA